MLKPIDKAFLGKVSELSGRNEDEHKGSLVMSKSEGRTLWGWVKAA